MLPDGITAMTHSLTVYNNNTRIVHLLDVCYVLHFTCINYCYFYFLLKETEI